MMVKTKGAADVGKKNSLYRGITNKNPKDPILNAQEEELAKPTKKRVINETEKHRKNYILLKHYSVPAIRHIDC